MTYLPPAKLDNNAADEQAGDAGKQDGAADAAADEQAGNVNKQPGVPNERDNAADYAGEQEGDDDCADGQEGLPRAVPVEGLILPS